MKVLIASTDKIPHVGGKSTHIEDLRCGLEEIGCTVKIISIKDISKKKLLFFKLLLAPLKVLNIAYYKYLTTQIQRKLMGNKILEICEMENFDIISAQDAIVASSCAKANRKLKIPLVLTMHTYFALEKTLDNKKTKPRSFLYNLYLRSELKCLDFVKGVICVDERIKEHVNNTLINQGFDSKGIQVDTISNFTNVNRFENDGLAAIHKRTWGFPENSVIGLCTRRLVEKNGVIYAVKALCYLPKELNFKLAIAGNGPQLNIIKKFIRDKQLEEKVIFLGDIDNKQIEGLYKSVDLTIVPSIRVNGLEEATSISAIESMASGLPTIASNIGGLKQLINNNETGILVEEKSSKEIANNIIKLIEDKEYSNYISTNASNFIIENHSHIRAAKEYYNNYMMYI